MADIESTKLLPHIERSLKALLEKYRILRDIVDTICTRGGRALLVGGAVRDLLLDRATKDIDIEVGQLTLEQLQEVLSEFGPVSLVGKSFGVFRVHGLDVDWSLPRSDGAGRKPEVQVDPFLPIKDAFARRDFTMNAMGIDLVSHELIDCFGGQKDLNEKVLRSPDISFFTQDPLRFYRVMQFIGRFEMVPDVALQNVCRTMDISTVSVERIDDEFQKLLLRSARPSLGIRWLEQVGRLKEILPELHATIDVPQDPEWHPEGDVFEHSMQALDAAAHFSQGRDDDQRIILMYSALCHDLGKATTTNKVDGRWRALGHEDAGADLSQIMLKRFVCKKDIVSDVVPLVKHHMVPMHFVEEDVKPVSYKRLAAKLSPVSLRMLADLAECDRRGRNPDGGGPLAQIDDMVEQFTARAQQAGVLDGREEPVLQGRDLLEDVVEGARMGELLRFAYRLQIEEGVTDRDELKKRVLRR